MCICLFFYFPQWNSKGYDCAKKFHRKFDLVSPVWLVVKGNDPYKIPTHDLDKSWLKDMNALNNKNHTVKGIKYNHLFVCSV